MTDPSVSKAVDPTPFWEGTLIFTTDKPAAPQWSQIVRLPFGLQVVDVCSAIRKAFLLFKGEDAFKQFDLVFSHVFTTGPEHLRLQRFLLREASNYELLVKQLRYLQSANEQTD